MVALDAPSWFDPFRFCIALLCGAIVWLTAGLAPLLLLSIHWPLVHDAPIMHYIAWRICAGAVPYRDILDMNMPGVYALHIAALKLFGDSDLGWRAFDFIVLTLTGLALWRLCRPIAGRWAAFAVLLYSAYHLSSGPPGMGQRDYLEFAFLVGGLLFTVEAFDHDMDRRRLAAAGTLFGCAMGIKPIAALLWLALALLALLQAERKAGDQWSRAIVFLCCGLTAPVALGAWIAVAGGLHSFGRILLGVMPAYAGMHDRPFLSYASEYGMIILPCLLTAPIAIKALRRDARRHALILGVLYGALHYGLQNKGWAYQLYPLVGFSAALLACSVGAAFKNKRQHTVVAVTALAVGLTAAIGAWDGRLRPAMALTADRTGTAAELTQDLRPRLSPGVTVQAFDTTGGCIHALLRLGIPQKCRCLCDFILFDQTDKLFVQSAQRELMSDLKAKRPTYLIVYRWGWPGGQYERLRKVPGLPQFIAEEYHVVKTRNQYVLYERKAKHARQALLERGSASD